MSQVATASRLAVVSMLATSLATSLQAQLSRISTSPAASSLSNPLSGGLIWRQLGLPSFDMHLAGAATGPANSVWYSADGGTLYVQTAAGSIFETEDFETWRRSEVVPVEESRPADVARLPEARATAIYAAGDSQREWALGHGLSMSEDGGRTWTTLSGSSAQPVIGAGQHAIAVDPSDPSALAVVNDEGIWQSRDGGKTWAGLNEKLPNLPIARIVSSARGAYKIALQDGSSLQFADTRAPWRLLMGENALAAEITDRQKATKALAQDLVGAEVTAVSRSGDLAYAGSSDGRVWISRDRTATWALVQTVGRGSVERFFIDPDEPRAAIAVIAGAGVHLARTVNAGAVWDDVTGNLSDVAVYAVTADRNSGTAYVTTEHGVFAAHVDLTVFTPASPWVPLAGSLPPSRGVDITFDAKTNRLLIAMDGYGLYATDAPVRGGALRIVNAADFSSRAAAPGSVISVIGGKVTGAQAAGLRFPVLAAGDSESQLQVPFEIRASGVDLAIAAASGRATVPLAVQSVSPAIFVDHERAPFLVDAESGLALDAGTPAHSRQVLQLMATGLGRVRPDWPTGVPAPEAERAPTVQANVQAFLDGEPLEVTHATLAPGYIGYYEVEVRLPVILNTGDAELYLLVDGQESNRVRVTVEAQ